MAEKITLRPLTTKDLYPMCKIITKLGAREILKCFDSPAVQKAFEGDGKFNIESVGISVMGEMAITVMEHLELVRDDLYKFLSSVSGVEINDETRLPKFAAMVISLFKHEDFKDFFSEVSELLRQETSDSSTSSTSDTQTLQT